MRKVNVSTESVRLKGTPHVARREVPDVCEGKVSRRSTVTSQKCTHTFLPFHYQKNSFYFDFNTFIMNHHRRRLTSHEFPIRLTLE